ncbi:NfeD family protein, partial [Klebsiella pneumoniae]|nr:NfeD family protein [Klebsiella pneumoniae]
SSLKKSKGYSTSKVYDDLVNKTGKTLTILRPSGKVELDGEIVDVVSTGFVIPEDTMIQVVKVEGSKIVVQVLENNNEKEGVRC